MPNRTGKKESRPDKGLDSTQNARRVVLESVGEYQEVTITRGLLSQVMASMGRKGGKTGGKRRMALLTAEERSAMGKAAAAKRWATKKKTAK
jgi:hypothetical protein